MPIDSVHPLYSASKNDWVSLRDQYLGENQVKSKGVEYLPATQGMELDGMNNPNQLGFKAYEAYKKRAVFHEYVKQAVESYLGLLFKKPPTIQLPSVMEPLRKSCTPTGESLLLLLRRIYEEQLLVGRVGLLADLPTNPDPAAPMPYITLYVAEAIRNWDDATFEEGSTRLNLVVLDETGFRRKEDFEWVVITKYRVLQLGELDANEFSQTYLQGVFINDVGSLAVYNPLEMKPPMVRGQPLQKIPFVFINSKDIVATPDVPPLKGLGAISLAIYRGEADYRQNLFMQGQDTLVVIGDVLNKDPTQEDTLRTGAGSRINLEQGGDAKYIGIDSKGLEEQRQALENDKKLAESLSAQLVNSTGQVESGVALETRVGAQTASLMQIAQTGAAGLEKVLKHIAEWIGANPEEVVVTPNTEFASTEFKADDIVKLMTARQLGAPLSKESIHNVLADKGLTKLDFETEMDKITEEDANSNTTGTGAGGNPAQQTGPQG